MDEAIVTAMRAPAVIRAAMAVDHESLSAQDLLTISQSISDARRSLDLYAAKLTMLTARKEAHTQAGASDITALIAKTNGLSRKDAKQQVQNAQTLENSSVLRTQMAKSGMSSVKVAIIGQTLADLPPTLSAQQRKTIESALAEAAPAMSVEQLRRKARRATEAVNVRLADEIENEQLTRAEEPAHVQAKFWMSRPDDRGVVKGGFEIDTLTADMLRSVIESKTSPRQHHGEPEAPYSERAGQAFVDVLRHVPKDSYGNHGGVAATLLVTVSEESLRGRTDAAGTTEHGTRVSAGQLRQLACTAGILPAVMSGNSQVLDLGTTRRLHSPAQRMALAVRDDGCAFPGCDLPPGWCESHHIDPWSNGGPTTIDNGVLLCGRHHRLIHNSNWEVRLGADKHPEFIPPAEVDPERSAQRNHRYRPLAA